MAIDHLDAIVDTESDSEFRVWPCMYHWYNLKPTKPYYPECLHVDQGRILKQPENACERHVLEQIEIQGCLLERNEIQNWPLEAKPN